MRLLFFSCFLCLNFSTIAQEITVGPEFGINIIDLKNSKNSNNYNICWNGGVTTHIKFNDYLGIKSGVQLAQRKKYYESFDTSTFEIFGFDPSSLGIPGVNFNVYHYTTGIQNQLGIEIPVMPSFSYENFSVYAGPYFHFMVGAWSRETEEKYTPFLQTIEIDSIDESGFLSAFFPQAHTTSFSESSSKENLRIFDFGFKAGISWSANNLVTSVNYNLGLPDYRIDRGTSTINRHSFFYINLSYQFVVLKKKSARSIN